VEAARLSGATPTVLDLGGLGRAVCHELQVPVPRALHGELGLFEELGLDSLGAFQLLVVIESLAGVEIPPREPPLLLTLTDAHRYYLALRGAVSMDVS
jgi:acyl carrier protein